jgi:acyl carrier protein
MRIFSFNNKKPVEDMKADPLAPDFSQVDVEQSLIAWLAKKLGISENQIDPEINVAEYGMDSILSAELSVFFEEVTGISAAPEVAWQFPTIRKLATYAVESRNGTW